jgi:hypothetical protein
MSTHVKVSGTWRELDKNYVKVSGSWREVDKGYTKVSGSWREVYSGLSLDDIGLSMEGGYFTGIIDTTSSGGLRYALIVSPRYYGETGPIVCKYEGTESPGTYSRWDGWTNTNNMNDSNHPAAYFCRNLNINGYNDWYFPAIDELEVCYRNLKPTDVYNRIEYGPGGYNPSSDPVGLSYTLTNPAQTTITYFQYDSYESLRCMSEYYYYWSSTSYGDKAAFYLSFYNGLQYDYHKYSLRGYEKVRAFRRVLL